MVSGGDFLTLALDRVYLREFNRFATLAQLVEQGTENPCVLGSIPRCGNFFVSEECISQQKPLLVARV